MREVSKNGTRTAHRGNRKGPMPRKTLLVLFLAPCLGSAAQTTTIYQIPAAGCVSIEQCIIAWPGELVTLNEFQHADEAGGPVANWPVLTVQSWSSEAGLVVLHNYSCPRNMDWTFTAVGKTTAGGTIGTVSAGCSGTDGVTGTEFTISYAFSAYSYQARGSGKGAGWRWQVTGGMLEVIQ